MEAHPRPARVERLIDASGWCVPDKVFRGVWGPLPAPQIRFCGQGRAAGAGLVNSTELMTCEISISSSHLSSHPDHLPPQPCFLTIASASESVIGRGGICQLATSHPPRRRRTIISLPSHLSYSVTQSLARGRGTHCVRCRRDIRLPRCSPFPHRQSRLKQ